MVLLIIGITLFISVLIFLVKPLRVLFQFELLSVLQIATCIGIGFISVIWFEAFKWWKRRAS